MSEIGRKRFVTVLILCLVTFFIGTLYASTTRSRAEGEDTAKESDAPAAADESVVTIGAGEEDAPDLSDYDAAEEYLGDYASMLENDKDFETHIEQALETKRTVVGNFATPWALLPPLIAILLALITKEVYSSLTIGIITGGLIYAGGNLETTMTHVVSDGFISSVADSYNIGIIIFLVLLGTLVALMNKAGGSAAFGRWATSHIKTRVGAQIATIILGILIFVDDYFNCLTVGSVMRPVTDGHKISRAKLAYLIDATAAPVCIIAPVSSWAAAVAGFAKGAGAESGLSLFISAIPYNYYALLTIVMMFFLALSGLDYGPMKKHETNAAKGDIFTSGVKQAAEEMKVNPKGKVIDLVLPVAVLIVCCVFGMIYSGGFFSGESFIDAFSNSDASVGLSYGAFIAIIITVVYFLCRRVLKFSEIMESLPDGFSAMVPAILILTCAWTLKAMTDSLGAKIFISQLVEGSAKGMQSFLPFIIFMIAVGLSFATGTSWGTFGILIPIVMSVFPAGNPLLIVSISACMAGAVCGDHCSPISDTTIMASAGAQCNHINHVSTQLPYAITVAIVSGVSYIVAGLFTNVVADLIIAVTLMIATLIVIKVITGKKTVAAEE